MDYGFDIPMDFEGLNAYCSSRSVAGRVVNDENTRYFMRSLYQRLISGAKFGIPKRWRKLGGTRYFKNVLFCNGFIGIADTKEYGVIPQICAPTGYGVFKQPVNMLIAQPLVNFEGKIGENCEIIHLTGDWRGVWDIVEHYAIRLSIAITSLDVSLFNSRVSFLAAAKNKSAAETLKYLYERVSAGEPFQTYDKVIKDDGLNEGDPIWTFQQNVKENYITHDLLSDIDTILHQFDREVGILAGTVKKERMIDSEVEANNDDSCARASTWLENLQDSFDNVNDLFPDLNLTFSLKYGGEEHVYNREIDADRVI